MQTVDASDVLHALTCAFQATIAVTAQFDPIAVEEAIFAELTAAYIAKASTKLALAYGIRWIGSTYFRLLSGAHF